MKLLGLHSLGSAVSGNVPAGIAVIRVSGVLAGDVTRAMAGPDVPPRSAEYRKICHPATGHLLDLGIVIWLVSDIYSDVFHAYRHFYGAKSFSRQQDATYHILTFMMGRIQRIGAYCIFSSVEDWSAPAWIVLITGIMIDLVRIYAATGT